MPPVNDCTVLDSATVKSAIQLIIEPKLILGWEEKPKKK